MEQPIERKTAATSDTHILDPASLPGQVVLVLQGGGALGSYQAGVYDPLSGVILHDFTALAAE